MLPEPSNAAEAIAVQKNLQKKINLRDGFSKVDLIAGIDVGYDKTRNFSRAIIALMRLDDLSLETSVLAFKETTFPYISGLLSFREIPVILEAFSALAEEPDLIFVDGQGIAHPRRLGIAAHLGVLLDRPAIGVAKSRLCGRYEEPGPEKGARSVLSDKGERIGTVLRSRNHVRPLFISPGHKISHETAVEYVLKTLTRYRLPEPTRIADKLSKVVK